MTNELVTLRKRDGTTAVAQADVVRHTMFRRAGTAAISAGGGIALALVFLPIPGLHFFSTWLFPLLGGVIAWYFGTKQGDVVTISAVCPSCQQTVSLPGGPIEKNMWRACPSCSAPFEVVFS